MTKYDGRWIRLLDDDTLELRDPNSGTGSGPDSKPRHQYRVDYWLLLRRVLPAAEYGDRFADDDIDTPWWEPVLELPPGGPIREYWERKRGGGIDALDYGWQARYTAQHVVAYTPNGREVRLDDDGTLYVQPHNDNYWLRVPDLRAARRAYYGLRDPNEQ